MSKSELSEENVTVKSLFFLSVVSKTLDIFNPSNESSWKLFNEPRLLTDVYLI